MWGIEAIMRTCFSSMANALAAVLILAACAPAFAQKRYDPGASDTEIRIGNVTPRTGAFSEFSAEPGAQADYFRMINDRGGINGRRINFISLDNGSDPRRSVRLARQLVEQDNVLLLFGTFGNAANVEIRAYANTQKIPHLFVQSSSAVFDGARRTTSPSRICTSCASTARTGCPWPPVDRPRLLQVGISARVQQRNPDSG